MVEQLGRSQFPKMVGGMFVAGAFYYFSYKKMLEMMPDKVKSFWLSHIQTSIYPRLLKVYVSQVILVVLHGLTRSLFFPVQNADYCHLQFL